MLQAWLHICIFIFFKLNGKLFEPKKAKKDQKKKTRFGKKDVFSQNFFQNYWSQKKIHCFFTNFGK